MLKIKPVYIYSLSNINVSNLFNFIRYNKALQNKLDKNILNYRMLGQRYFIGDKNGKRKKYSLMQHIGMVVVVMIIWCLKVNIKIEKEMERKRI